MDSGGNDVESFRNTRKLKQQTPKLNTAAIRRSAGAMPSSSNRTARSSRTAGRPSRGGVALNTTSRGDGKRKPLKTAVSQLADHSRQSMKSSFRGSPQSSSSSTGSSASTPPSYHQRSLPNFHGTSQEQPFPWELRARLEQRFVRNASESQARVEQRMLASPTFYRPSTAGAKQLPWETRIASPPPIQTERTPVVVLCGVIERILSLELDPVAREIKRKTLTAAAAKQEARSKAYNEARMATASKQSNADVEQKEPSKRSKSANASVQKAATEAKMKAISEAGRLAAEEASSSPLKTIEQLELLKERKEADKAELLARLELLSAGKTESLKRQLGEAILERGVSTNKLMDEWDRNGDGELSKIEFKQAIRLSLNLKASNEEIDSLFDSFDDDGGGSLSLTELRPAIRQIHQHCRAQRDHEKLTINRKQFCETQLQALKECIASTTIWDTARCQLAVLRSGNALEVTLGFIFKQKLAQGHSFGELAEQFGGDANGFLDRDGFIR